MATKKPPFKPEAIDADGDGIVQEGTEFERPIEPEVIVEAPASSYLAEDGDSYASIAAKFPKPGLSKHDRSSELYALNGGKKLNPGTEVKL